MSLLPHLDGNHISAKSALLSFCFKWYEKACFAKISFLVFTPKSQVLIFDVDCKSLFSCDPFESFQTFNITT